MKNYFGLDMDGNTLLKTHKAEEVRDWLTEPRVGLIWLTPTYVKDCRCYYRHPDYKGDFNNVFGQYF